jgi:hypothetical protein
MGGGDAGKEGRAARGAAVGKGYASLGLLRPRRRHCPGVIDGPSMVASPLPAATTRRRPAGAAILPAATSPAAVHTLDGESHERAEVERFIHVCFRDAYGADVQSFLPVLMALRGAGGELLAALGLREAATGPLFLEQYLDRPVDAVVAERLGVPVARGGVVEVGNLAAAHAGGARWLITALTAFLHARGAEWVVFTAVSSVRNAFLRLGLAPVALAPAPPQRLGEAAREWGRYYDGAPLVMAGQVAHGYQVLRSAILLQGRLAALLPVWEGAHVRAWGGE